MNVRKVLIVTYYWPPSAGSGVQRWLKFAKYLPEFSWHPVIYTPENPDFDLLDKSLLKDIPEDCTVIKTRIWEPYALAKKFSGEKKINTGIIGDGSGKPSRVKKIMNWVRGNFFIPDPRVFWVKPSVKYLHKYLLENEIEHIITTGPPHSMHLIGRDLKRKIPQLKWVADIRDPWSKLDFLDTFHVTKRNRKKYSNIERSVLQESDAVIATSPSMKHQLVEFDHSKFTCITNGFDKEDFANFNGRKEEKGEIRIYHAGLLNKIRNPINLWETLDELCEKDEAINSGLIIHLAGVIDPEVIESIKAFPYLKSKLIVEGYKSHEEVLKDYERADILLLLINNTYNAQVNIPGKLFEYFATGKKILCVGDLNSDASNLVNKTRTGLVVDFNSKMAHEDLINLFFKRNMEIADNNQHFSRKALTKELVNILENLKVLDR